MKGKRLCSNQKASGCGVCLKWKCPRYQVLSPVETCTLVSSGAPPYCCVLWYPGLVPLLFFSLSFHLLMNNFTKPLFHPLLCSGTWMQFDKAVGLFCLIFFTSTPLASRVVRGQSFLQELVSIVKFTYMGLCRFCLGHTNPNVNPTLLFFSCSSPHHAIG